MTQEQKDLLFKDLSARLPYHVKVKVWLEDGTTEEGFLDLAHNYADVLRGAFYYNKIKDIKPYLFPITSMNDEQRKELSYISGIHIIYGKFYTNDEFTLEETLSGINWLLKNHFDINGLIPKGLANDATGLNIY